MLSGVLWKKIKNEFESIAPSQSLNKMRNLIKLRVTIQVRVSWACGHFPLKKRTKSSTFEIF